MNLRQWIIAYQIPSGSMTQQEWDKVFAKFCTAYQKFITNYVEAE
jgi:hypothetical protein